MLLKNKLLFLISVLATFDKNCGLPSTQVVSDLIMKLPDNSGLVKYFEELELKRFCDIKLLETTEIQDIEKNSPALCLCSVMYYMIKDSIKSKVDASDVKKAKDDIKANDEEFVYNTWKEVSKSSQSLALFMKPLDTLEKWRKIYYNIENKVTVLCKMVNLEVISLYNALSKTDKVSKMDGDSLLDQKKNIDKMISLPAQSESSKDTKIVAKEKTSSVELEKTDEIKKKNEEIIISPQKNYTNTLPPKLDDKVKNTEIQHLKAIYENSDTDAKLPISTDKKEEDYGLQLDTSNKEEYPDNDIEHVNAINADKAKEDVLGENLPSQEPVKENPNSVKKSLILPDNPHVSYTNGDDIDKSEYPIDKDINTNKKDQLVIIPKEKFMTDDFSDPKESRFLFYFTIITVLSMIFYLVLYNKKKIIALLIEGRRSNNSHRRRPNIAGYSKVETEDGATVF